MNLSRNMLCGLSGVLPTTGVMNGCQREAEVGVKLAPDAVWQLESRSIAILSLDVPVTNGQKIKNRRHKLKKTRKQLASELGVSTKTLWSREAGRRQPTTQVQERIAKFLDMSELS